MRSVSPAGRSFALVMALLFIAPAAFADDLTVSPRARIGGPPGIEAQGRIGIPPGSPADDPGTPTEEEEQGRIGIPPGEPASQGRISIPPGAPVPEQQSLWAQFMTWFLRLL